MTSPAVHAFERSAVPLEAPGLRFPALLVPCGAYAPIDEVVERRGVGHPDSICDHVAEALTATLTRHFLERYGRRFHVDVDAALLAAGAVEVGFGGGRVVRPTRIVLAGRVDRRAGPLPMEELVEAAYARLFEVLPWATRETYRIELSLERSVDDLSPSLDPGKATTVVPLAHETSVASAFAVRTPLERAVHGIEGALGRPEFRAAWPVGSDVKVLGTRIGDIHRFDVAVAVLAGGVGGLAAYRAVLDAVRHEIARAVLVSLARPGGDDIRIAVAINEEDRSPDRAHLTLSGSSAESGANGQGGRGNRIGGLITPCRFASVGASCGRDPWAHVGKLHQAIAWDAAHAIALDGSLQTVSVTLTSSIGARVDGPGRLTVRAHLEEGTPDTLAVRRVALLVRDAVADWAGAAARLEAGAYVLA